MDILKEKINFYKIKNILSTIIIDNVLNNRIIIKAIIKAI